MKQRTKKQMIAGLSVLTSLLSLSVSATADPQTLEFHQLPKEIRNHVVDVRTLCKEADPERTVSDMQGIIVLDLKGNGARDIIVDDEEICGEHLSGYNCSNRGCDMMIYKEAPRNVWRKIFHEHLYDRHLVIDWDHMRLQMLVASIYAGDPRCKPKPKAEYTSGKSCNLIVTYRNNGWNWSLIR
jgi:hypothetical protein